MSPAAFPCQRPGGAGPCHASRFLAARGFSGVGRALRARLSASRHDLRSTARGAAGPPRMALAGMRNAPCARPRALHPLRGQLSFRPHPRPSARPFAREPDRPLLPPPSTRFAAPLIVVNNRRHLTLTLLFLAFTSSLLSANRPAAVNLLDYGTVPDGKTKNTAAIAACAQAGGGTILFPAGQYLAGSILPESDQTLHLEAGAELLYSGDPADSPLVAWRWECTNVFTRAPLIYAEGKHTIAITGRGTLNGQGWNWWWRSNSRGRKSPSRPRRRRQPGRVARPLRPHRTRRKTRRRRLHPGRPIPPPFPHRSLSPQKRPRRRHHPLQFPHVDAPPRLLRRCRRARHPLRLRRSRGPNSDGIDIDSSRNVRISDCFFDASDDCIVIKSGRDHDGLRTNRPTEFVSTTNCVMFQGHGAGVIGSETSGGIRNITARNCVSVGTDCGIRIKFMRGRGGVLGNFRFDHWVIEDAKKQAFEINTRYHPSPTRPSAKPSLSSRILPPPTSRSKTPPRSPRSSASPSTPSRSSASPTSTPPAKSASSSARPPTSNSTTSASPPPPAARSPSKTPPTSSSTTSPPAPPNSRPPPSLSPTPPTSSSAIPAPPPTPAPSPSSPAPRPPASFSPPATSPAPRPMSNSARTPHPSPSPGNNSPAPTRRRTVNPLREFTAPRIVALL